MSEGNIIAEKHGHLGRLIFNNPDRHNAMSRAMWGQLADTMEMFDGDDDIRVVVLEGAGDRAFVSGADISKFESERADPERIKEYGVAVNRGYASLQYAQTPTIAKIKGICFGGGMGIAVSCDLRICSDDSSFCIPAAKLGVGYGHENTKVLIDLVGPSYAKEIFYTARRFDTEEVKTMGLVNRVVAHAELDDYVSSYVEAMTNNAPLSLKTTNVIINELLKDEGERDLALCNSLVEDCSKSEDIQEGRRAFMEKRKPVFKGR
ncbi:MAG: enoyl-CoA hydratase [Gammaproteobacteria bacterium]|jgi:enoyl-CoA hydratase